MKVKKMSRIGGGWGKLYATCLRIAALSLCGVALDAFADGPYWLRAASDNSKSTAAYKNAADWEDAGGTASGAANDPLDTSATYIINNGRVMRGNSGGTGSWSFGGKSLVLGDRSKAGTVLLYESGTTYEFGRDGLILSNGYLTTHGAYNRNFTVSGTIMVVDGTESAPKSFIQMSYSGCTLKILAAIKGGSGAVLDVGAMSSWGKSYDNRNQKLELACDCSEFLGLMNLKAERSNSISEPYCNRKFVFAPTTAFAGRLKMNAGTFLQPKTVSDVATIASLDLCAGTTVDFMAGGLTNSQFIVTDSLTVESGVTLRLTETALLTHTETAFLPFITAPAACLTDEVAELFSVEADVSNKVWVARLEVRGEGATRTLGVSIPPLVYQTRSDNGGKGFPDPLDLSSSDTWTSLTNELNWSDGRAVHAGAHYRVEGSRTTACSLRTKWDEASYTFPGDSLTIGNLGRLVVSGQNGNTRTFNCTNLNFEAGGELVAVWHVGANFPYGFALTSPSGSGEVGMRMMTGRTLKVAGEVTGTGDMVLLGNQPSSSPQGFYYFGAFNTNWFGRTRLDHVGIAPYRITNGCWQTLCLTDERNLGGKLQEFDWKALTLDVAGALRTYDTTPVTLTTNYNRGVYVNYLGQFDTYRASHSLTVNTQITMNGLLRKIGPGKLAMGGTVKFLGEDGEPCDTPRATSNIFEIAEGTVTLTSARACDGMTMSFKGGASAVLKLDAANADLAEYGFINVRTDTPFVLDDGMSALPVSLDWSGVGEPETPMELGLVTVSNNAETVASVRAMLPTLRTPWASVRCDIVEIPRQDEGSVTFAARLTPTGIRFIIR